MAVLLAAVLAACGSSAATTQDVIARGNAICTDTLRDIRSIPAPAGQASSTAALAAYLRSVIPIVDKEIADIRGLPRPAHDRALLDRYVTALAATGTQYRALAGAASAGDSSVVDAGLSALQGSPAAALARQYGLSQCSAPGGTGVGTSAG
jgi:hypothetical protein